MLLHGKIIILIVNKRQSFWLVQTSQPRSSRVSLERERGDGVEAKHSPRRLRLPGTFPAMFASFLAFKRLVVCGAEGDSSRHRFTITSNDAWLSVVLKFLKFVSLRSHGLHTKRGKTSLRGSAFPYRYSAVARSCGFPLLQRFFQWEISPTDLQSRQQLKLTDLLAVYNFLGVSGWLPHDHDDMILETRGNRDFVLRYISFPSPAHRVWANWYWTTPSISY